MYIRIQGIHNKPQENKKNKDTQRKAFKEAKAYFEDKYPEIKCPSINLIEKLHTHFIITSEEEKLLCNTLLKMVISLGEYVVGDEKLFRFTENSGFIRLVLSKPDKIGLWNYMLAAKLSNGKPFLLYVKFHNASKALGESIPTSSIINEWADVIIDRYSSNFGG